MQQMSLMSDLNGSFVKLSQDYDVAIDEILVVNAIFEDLSHMDFDDFRDDVDLNVQFLFDYGFTLTEIAQKAHLLPEQAQLALGKKGKEHFDNSKIYKMSHEERQEYLAFVSDFARLI
jgi:hypothetical protein